MKNSKINRRKFLASSGGSNAAALMANWQLELMAAEGRSSTRAQYDGIRALFATCCQQ